MTENGPKKFLSVQIQYINFNFRFMFSLKWIFRFNFKKSSFLVFRAMFFRSKDRTPEKTRSNAGKRSPFLAYVPLYYRIYRKRSNKKCFLGKCIVKKHVQSLRYAEWGGYFSVFLCYRTSYDGFESRNKKPNCVTAPFPQPALLVQPVRTKADMSIPLQIRDWRGIRRKKRRKCIIPTRNCIQRGSHKKRPKNLVASLLQSIGTFRSWGKLAALGRIGGSSLIQGHGG